MRYFWIVSVALALAGCSGEITPQLALTQVYPAECKAKPERWQPLPDKAVTQSELARNYAENKERFRRQAAKRRVCAAGLVEGGGA